MKCEAVITVRTSFSRVISVSEAKACQSRFSKVADKLFKIINAEAPQILALPFSETQPEEVPIAIMQIENKMILTLTRRSFAVQLFSDDLDSASISRRCYSLLSTVINKKAASILGRKARLIAISITFLYADMEYGDMLNYMSELVSVPDDYSSDSMGASLSYSQKKSDSCLSYEAINYSTMFNEQDREVGIRIEKYYTAGGYDFETKKFNDLTEDTLEKIVLFAKQDKLRKSLEAIDGLSNPE